ncbi:hypothetical protein [Kitasatospora sp. NPDC056181]|uniref:hypothetical protein n=1 Tax=Kitasatospora sp. NPDC056181 TaxID=3345737 RepID=UPI0035DA202B
MNARIEDARPPGRTRASGAAVRALARGLLLLAGLATVVLGFSRFVDAYESVDAYRSAPRCGTAAAAPGAPCVRHETGKVTARTIDHTGDSDSYDLTVARESGPGQIFSVGKAFYDGAKVGTDVDLRIWNGRLVEVSWHGHRASPPDIPWLSSFKLALLVGAGSALVVCGLAWPRGSAQAVPVIAAFWIALFSFLGSFFLCLAQWPFAVTLAVPVLGWLFVTTISTSVAREI